MVTYDPPLYGAIADPTRREILDMLRCGERSAGEIADCFPVSRPAISRHLRVLREAGLVREHREAQSRIYRLDPRPLGELDRWLEHYRVFWTARLQGLKQHVESQPTSRPERTR